MDDNRLNAQINIESPSYYFQPMFLMSTSNKPRSLLLIRPWFCSWMHRLDCQNWYPMGRVVIQLLMSSAPAPRSKHYETMMHALFHHERHYDCYSSERQRSIRASTMSMLLTVHHSNVHLTEWQPANFATPTQNYNVLPNAIRPLHNTTHQNTIDLFFDALFTPLFFSGALFFLLPNTARSLLAWNIRDGLLWCVYLLDARHRMETLDIWVSLSILTTSTNDEFCFLHSYTDTRFST